MNLKNLHEEHESSEWATLYALGELSVEETDAFEQHLRGGCMECQTSLQFEDLMAALVAPASTSPPAALRERLLKRVVEDLRGHNRH